MTIMSTGPNSSAPAPASKGTKQDKNATEIKRKKQKGNATAEVSKALSKAEVSKKGM